MDKERAKANLLGSFIGVAHQGKEDAKESTRDDNERSVIFIGDDTTSTDKNEKERVWVMLTPDDKHFCKRMAKHLKGSNQTKGGTYSDYIEYLIRKEREFFEE